ncbi:endonuclease [Reticulomyxa filosa]|uniref:Crossover junction endonuclease MUS81 n=1 Tax=Reticulomyxa filosa TaxID=46433 RepID=X6MIZ5_RETFI|nr:endonuclease [Reticulomyxa filosa]|eukprot:ETO13372.1 endonuclease [Reticulomyxa filosa]
MLCLNIIFEQKNMFWLHLFLYKKNSNVLVNGDSVNELLKGQNIHCETRSLGVGDYIWILQDKQESKQEWVLNVVIERKRMDDLEKSIHDGRLVEQKLRLINCGIAKKMYLIEGDDRMLADKESGSKRCQQAIADTQIKHSFLIVRTKNHSESCNFLTRMTKLLYQSLEHKQLENVCISFEAFQQSKKAQKFPARFVFVRQLLAVNNVTPLIALSITRVYPTLKCLYDAWEKLNGDICAEKELIHKTVRMGTLDAFLNHCNGDIEMDECLTMFAQYRHFSSFSQKDIPQLAVSLDISEKIWKAFRD